MGECEVHFTHVVRNRLFFLDDALTSCMQVYFPVTQVKIVSAREIDTSHPECLDAYSGATGHGPPIVPGIRNRVLPGIFRVLAAGILLNLIASHAGSGRYIEPLAATLRRNNEALRSGRSQ